MKEIKYQVYHKPTKTIQVVALIDFNNKVLDTYGIDEPIYGIPFEDVEWREYTGLKDKNGQGIYSRDIVKSKDNIIYKVHWDEEDICFRPFGIHYYFCNFTYEDVYTCIQANSAELVGNIDQHPELLNEKSNN